MNHLKKVMVALLCSAVMTAPIGVINTEAATFDQVNADEVFVNQDTDVTCTLASNVMLLRRAALMLGDPKWMTITESKCRYDYGLWVGGGMVCDYTFYGTTKNVVVVNDAVRYVVGTNSRQSIKQYLIDMLRKHPEGIVYYDYDIPHAILLTDYVAAEDMFYCSDPNKGTPTKRVPLTNSNVNLYNYYRSSVWYIKSPELHFTSGSTATSSGKQIEETWKVTDEAGLNFRADAGVSYGKIGFVPCGTVVKVTKKRENEGYTWGYVNYDSKNGWIALNYATKLENNAAAEKAKTDEPQKLEDTHNAFENKSSISADTIVLGEKITFHGAADKGNAPYQYAYYYKRSYNSNWTTVQEFSTSDRVSVEPLTATAYDVCIKVKDAKGNVEKKYMTFEVKKPLENKSSVASHTVYLGGEISLKGKATGGIGKYSYVYYQKRHEDEKWCQVKDFSEETTASFKPLKATNYDICIKVRDEKGTIQKVYETVEVCPKLVNSSKISANYVKVGDMIKLSAAAQGGAGKYQNAFYVKSEESSGWTTLKDFSDSTTAVFTAMKATTYDVCVKVRDFYGKVEKKYFKVYARK